MATNLTIPQSTRAMFASGIERVAQQIQKRFAPFATVKTGCTGKSQAHRKINKMEAQESTGRLQDTNAQEIGLQQRFLFPRKAWLASILDEDDAKELDLSVAPTGEISIEHASALNRKADSIFLSGITGNNLEGLEDSMSTVALPAAQTIAVNYRRDGGSGNTGLTLAKLVRAKGRFGKQEVFSPEQREMGAKLCMAVSQDEMDNLLYDVTQTGSADYNKVKALVDGEVDYFMGIHFIRSELLSVGATSGGKFTRTCPMWINTGVHLDFWYDVTARIDELPTKTYALQVYSKIKLGACRKDENRVVLVLCEQDA